MLPGVRNVEMVIVAALALSAPTFVETYDGGVGISTALFRFTMALALCWAAGAMIERTFDTYTRQNRRREHERRMVAIREAQAARASAEIEQAVES